MLNLSIKDLGRNDIHFFIGECSFKSGRLYLFNSPDWWKPEYKEIFSPVEKKESIGFRIKKDDLSNRLILKI